MRGWVGFRVEELGSTEPTCPLIIHNRDLVDVSIPHELVLEVPLAGADRESEDAEHGVRFRGGGVTRTTRRRGRKVPVIELRVFAGLVELVRGRKEAGGGRQAARGRGTTVVMVVIVVAGAVVVDRRRGAVVHDGEMLDRVAGSE